MATRVKRSETGNGKKREEALALGESEEGERKGDDDDDDALDVLEPFSSLCVPRLC
jgi:hypothetical protein